MSPPLIDAFRRLKYTRSAWYLRNLSDGTFYYSAERRSKRNYIIVGPGDRDPTPAEIASHLEAHPNAEFSASLKLLIECHGDDSAESPVELPGGVYNYERSTHFAPERIEPMNLRQDSYYRLPGVFDSLSADIEHFLKGESIYQELGLEYRRGILLYGPPGNGKTSLIREIVRAHFLNDAIVIFMDRVPSSHFVRLMRETLANRFKVIIFEEMGSTLKASGLDHTLAFLDGEMSLNRCLILATTNYPEQLPGNIVDRPSRFDRLYRVSDPNENCRNILLQSYLVREISDLEIDSIKGLSAAALREACLLVKIREIALSEAIKRLKQHKDIVKKEFGTFGEIGIKAGCEFDDY